MPRAEDRRRWRRRLVAVALLGLGAVLGRSSPAVAWGFAGHRLVNRMAIRTLPPPLRVLFEGNTAYLVEHSIDPDLWRAAGKEGEAPNHFLDMDAFGSPPFEGIPRVEADHLAKHGPDAVSKGRVPWRVGEAYRDLVAAFKARDHARILAQAAVLGHYVGDAHVPLHAVLNYDGQLTGQTGFHNRWESEMVERFERQIEPELRPVLAQTAGDPVLLTFDALLESYSRSGDAFAADRASAGPEDFADTAWDDRYDDAYYSKLYEREGATLRARLASAASTLGSLWLTAWEEADQPHLDLSFRLPYVRKGSRMVLVTLDGSSAPLIGDAVSRGVMPHLARVRAEGATARGSVTSLPAKTAAGHASVFTGAWPDRNGITGNEVPIPGASVLHSTTGYASTPLRAEPIWATSARQGLEVSVFSATQVYPFSPYLEERRFGGNFGRNLTLLDGYQGHTVEGAVYTARDVDLRPAATWTGELPPHRGALKEFEIAVNKTRLDGLVYDDPNDPIAGFDTFLLAPSKDVSKAVRLKPRIVDPEGTEGFASLIVKLAEGELGLHFRLFALSPDASEVLLYRAEAGQLSSNKPLVENAVLKATGGFVGNGASHLYEEGRLGPPLWKGGDGTAEKRYVETVRLVARQFSRLLDFGYHRTRWDLLVGYLPYPDEALHLWRGYLDPTLRGHDPALAARLRPYLDQVLRIVDGYVGHLAEHVGSEQILAVASDHGMIGTNRSVRLNVALEKAGLLAVQADGTIDLSRTRAVYFPGNSGYFLINRVSRKGGIVRPEEEEDVRARLTAVLRDLKDTETGERIVTEVLDPRTEGRELGIGGPHGGDLYLSMAPGYYPGPGTQGEVVQKRDPRGEHLLDPKRPEMHAAFVVAGPGVASGAELGVIRQIDIAPTLCTLLGIDPPAQAAGRVLEKALVYGWAEGVAASRAIGNGER